MNFYLFIKLLAQCIIINQYPQIYEILLFKNSSINNYYKT